MKYLFLYTELADYTIQCFKYHLNHNPEDEIHVVSYEVNGEAPFVFEEIERLHKYKRKECDLDDLWQIIEVNKPALIFCSGWIDKQYLATIRLARHKTPCFLIVDNPWLGTLKQRLLSPFGKYYFGKLFKGAWVPGNAQKEFMQNIGFKPENIFQGFYSTDVNSYTEKFLENREEKRKDFPKVFVCAARYIPQKGLETLWQAFAKLDHPEWELWMFGQGVDFDQRMKHPKIKHFGFVQPKELLSKIKDMGVFILPSMLEPWGMVVHEFAVGGFPLLLSDKVYSGARFLREGKNGFTFRPGSIADIKRQLKKITQMSTAELSAMSDKSFEIAKEHSAEAWSTTLRQILHTFVK